MIRTSRVYSSNSRVSCSPIRESSLGQVKLDKIEDVGARVCRVSSPPFSAGHTQDSETAE